MKIRNATLSDISDIVTIHESAFKGFFLTSLGKRFLCTYYKTSLESRESIVLVAVDEKFNQSIGFAAGCIHSKGYHKRLLFNNLLSFLFSAGLGLLKNPAGLIRLIKNLDKKSSKNDNGQYGELLSIGIIPEYSGKGTGKELLFKFETAMITKGVKKLALTTDTEDNEGVFAFYLKNGYQEYSTFTTYPNRKMYRLIKVLDETNI